MKASELRQGNIIDVLYSSLARPSMEPRHITAIVRGTDDESVITNCAGCPNEDKCNGVPLTEEWLLKFGFKTITEWGNGNFNYWNKAKDCSVDVEPNITPNTIETLFYYRVHEQLRRRPLLFVHQLQNLYFALTGQELDINHVANENPLD